jgi:flagellar motor protein MotB
VESDVHAKMIFIETNLLKREFNSLKLSNQAQIIAEYHNLIKQQGKRNDLLSEEELERDKKEKEAKAPSVYNLSKSQIANYIRINEQLMSELKDNLDDGSLSIRAAVQITNYTKKEQGLLAKQIKQGFKLTEAKIREIEKEADQKPLTNELIEKVLTSKSKKKKRITLPDQLVDELFFNMNEDKIFELIREAVIYFRLDE